jgi:hypothetical protein
MTDDEIRMVNAQTLKPLYDELERYAGWLDRERKAVTVRNDVLALGVAIDAGTDPSPLLQTLNLSLARLPGGEVRKIMVAASKRIQSAIAAAAELSQR